MRKGTICLVGAASLLLAAVPGIGRVADRGSRMITAGAPFPGSLPKRPDPHSTAPDAPVIANVGGFTPGGCVQVCEDIPACEEIREMPAQANDASCTVALSPADAGFQILSRSCPRARAGGVKAVHDGKKFVLRCAAGN